MLWKVATPRFLLPRLSRPFSQSLSSSGSAKSHRKPAHARRQQPLPTFSYSRRGTEKSVLHVHTASSYYSPQGRDSQHTMEQPNWSHVNSFKTQVTKMERRDQNQQNMTRGSQQQNPPMWSSIPPSVGSSADNNGVGFNGTLMQNGPNVFDMNTAQSLMSSGFSPQFFASNMGAHMNMNMGFFSPSDSFWPSPGNPNNGQHASSDPSLDNQFASSTQQDTVSRTPMLAPQTGTVPGKPMATANTSASTARHRQDITAPSQESGGIPNPTDAYLMRASFMPKRRTQPGPLLVVIDLNGTLLYRPSRKNTTSFQSRRHTEKFVTYCVQTFWVVFWSSAKPENVKSMVDQLLSKPLRRQVVGVWGRDKFGLTQQDYNKRTQCYKRLTKLWNDPLIKSSYPRQRPGFEGGCWDQGNTVLIDDSVEKARSEPHNAITLPEYLGGVDDESNVLPNVHDYLNELCYQEDVSAYMRAHPFKMN